MYINVHTDHDFNTGYLLVMYNMLDTVHDPLRP